MSVLIKDMEMPKKCGECDIYVCYRTWNGDPGDEFCGMTKENVSYKAKPDWCPLAEVPERKPGKWKVQTDEDRSFIWWKCSECGHIIFSESERDRRDFHAFCGRCGADMRERWEE